MSVFDWVYVCSRFDLWGHLSKSLNPRIVATKYIKPCSLSWFIGAKICQMPKSIAQNIFINEIFWIANSCHTVDSNRVGFFECGILNCPNVCVWINKLIELCQFNDQNVWLNPLRMSKNTCSTWIRTAELCEWFIVRAQVTNLGNRTKIQFVHRIDSVQVLVDMCVHLKTELLSTKL